MERGIVTKLHSLLERCVARLDQSTASLPCLPRIVIVAVMLIDTCRYMLRRTKDEVHLSLPPKAETLVYTRLTAEQVHLLKAIRSSESRCVSQRRSSLRAAMGCGSHHTICLAILQTGWRRASLSWAGFLPNIGRLSTGTSRLLPAALQAST